MTTRPRRSVSSDPIESSVRGEECAIYVKISLVGLFFCRLGVTTFATRTSENDGAFIYFSALSGTVIETPRIAPLMLISCTFERLSNRCIYFYTSPKSTVPSRRCRRRTARARTSRRTSPPRPDPHAPPVAPRHPARCHVPPGTRPCTRRRSQTKRLVSTNPGPERRRPEGRLLPSRRRRRCRRTTTHPARRPRRRRTHRRPAARGPTAWTPGSGRRAIRRLRRTPRGFGAAEAGPWVPSPRLPRPRRPCRGSYRRPCGRVRTRVLRSWLPFLAIRGLPRLRVLG